MATLYIIGTPIGNLEDITLRALRVLKEADVILCEDTRVTKRLLDRHAINVKRLLAYNEQKSGTTTEKILDLFRENMNVALVTDAGTPGVSDPGSMLVERIRAVLPDVKIESVPGPSAIVTALSVAGIPVHDFVFLGFLPHKKGRETLFKEIAQSKRAVIFYESPYRIVKALESLKKFAPAKQVVVCRELTKIYEEVVGGIPEKVLEYFKINPDKVRGEFVVIISS